MSTVEIVKFRDVIRVTGIPQFIPGLSPPTLVVRGEDFSSVDRLFISEVEVLDFVVVNKTTLYAAFPLGVKSISSIEAVSSKITRTAAASRVDFSFGRDPKRATGVVKLVQLYLMWLFRDPSTDIFAPGSGGGLLNVANDIHHTGNILQLRSAVAQAVETTTRQIMQSQTNLRLPAAERLLRTELLALGPTSVPDEIRAKILIESFADDAAEAAFAL